MKSYSAVSSPSAATHEDKYGSLGIYTLIHTQHGKIRASLQVCSWKRQRCQRLRYSGVTVAATSEPLNSGEGGARPQDKVNTQN